MFPNTPISEQCYRERKCEISATGHEIRDGPCTREEIRAAELELRRAIMRAGIRRFVSAARVALPREEPGHPNVVIYPSLRKLIARFARLARKRRPPGIPGEGLDESALAYAGLVTGICRGRAPKSGVLLCAIWNRGVQVPV